MHEYTVKRYGIEIDLSLEGKTQCPKCAKNGEDSDRDNFHVYGIDGEGKHKGAFCWACEYTIPSEDYLEQNEEDSEEEYEIVGSEFNSEVKEKIKESTGMNPKGYRGISEDDSKLYRVRYQYSQEDGSVEKTLYPCTTNGKLTGYKVRTHPKDFKSPGAIGETGVNCDLFGQFLFKTHSGFIVICGGEHDAMAAYQMLNAGNNKSKFDAIACVSPTIGESGGHKQVKKQYDFFNSFKKIIVCMDADEAGEKASEKVCESLPRGKVHVMKMRRKDPNEYLERNVAQDFINDFWAAKPYTPAGIHGSSTLLDAALTYSDLTQLSLPKFLKKAQSMFDGGLVKNELSCTFAETSIGKSLFVDSMAVNWILNEPEEVVGVLSLEATKDKWATNILSNFLGVKLIKMKGEERKEYLNRPDVIKKVKPFLENEDGSDRFYVMDERGSGIEVVKEKIVQMIIEMGVTLLIIDVYSDLLDGLPLDQQEELVGWLKRLLKQYPQVSIMMVCHTRKRPPGGGGHITESDIMGTSTVMKSAAQTISLERDKQADDPFLRNCTFVRIHKNRHFSETGPAGVVYYEHSTGRLFDLDDYLEDNPEMREEAESALEGLR